MNTDFASLLRRLRLEAGLSQEALAAQAGVSTISIGSYERGFRTAPRKEMIAALVGALQLSGESQKQFEAAAKRKRAPAASTDEPKHNLPWQPTSFIGRVDAIAEISELLMQRRLVTITGAGGIGKTRTVLEIVSHLTESQRDGAWFVDLSSLTDGAFIANMIAWALNLRPSQEDDLLTAVVAILKPRELILVLDNCEHLIEGACEVAKAILHGCPQITLIATSRERLGIANERTYPLPTLLVPDRSISGATKCRTYEAIALFADRAETAKHGFVFSDEQATQAADICRRLDGIALAIELAAARIPVLGISGVQAQLSKHFDIIAGGGHDFPARQQTLHATIAWSHALLDARERTLFRRLAIFADSWTLESAETVCADSTLTKRAVLALLSSLAEKSLVIVDVERAGPRYSFFASTRAYALEQLAASSEYPAFARRHAEWIASIGDRSYDSYAIVATRDELAVAPELDVCAALEWAFGPDGDALIAGRIAAAVRSFWQTARLSLNARGYIEAALKLVSASDHPLLVARLLINQAQFLDGPAIAENMRRAIASLDRDGNQRTLATCHSCLAFALANMGHHLEAERVSDQASALLHEAGLQHTPLYAEFLLARTVVFRSPNSRDKERSAALDALVLANRFGLNFLIARCQLILAEIAFDDGNLEDATALGAEALASFRRLRSSTLEIYILCNLASYLIATGALQRAECHACDALTLARTGIAHPTTIYISLGHLATIEALRGQTASSARILGHVDAWYQRTGSSRGRTEQKGYDIAIASLRKQLTNDEIEKLREHGAALSSEAVINEAQKLHNFGQSTPNV